VGYFNPRPNTGIYDDLLVRVILFEKDGVTTGMMVYDLCFLSAELVAEIKAALKKADIDFADNLMLSATHTHTGPYIAKFFGYEADRDYLDSLIEKSVTAVRNAAKSFAPAELRLGSIKNNPYAYNRRYWMKNGKVLTNPGKLNPNVERPEGTVNPDIGILSVYQDNRISAIIAHLSNHTDTVGGNFVSADWPGRMERKIQMALSYDYRLRQNMIELVKDIQLRIQVAQFLELDENWKTSLCMVNSSDCRVSFCMPISPFVSFFVHVSHSLMLLPSRIVNLFGAIAASCMSYIWSVRPIWSGGFP